MSEEENIKSSPQEVNKTNSSEPLIEQTIPSTINDQPPINIGAHHPHPVTIQKKWSEYLLEFFMLFLAVFLGFVAENIREVSVDHEQEKGYMKSMVRDLIADKENLKEKILYKSNDLEETDSLFNLFENLSYKDSTSSMYYFGRKLMRRRFFYLTDGTLQQLRNAGGFRLIRNSQIIDSIQSYLNLYNAIIQEQQLEESQLIDFRHAAAKVFDVFVFEKMLNGTAIIKPTGNPPLLSYNKEDINIMLMAVHTRQRNVLGQMDAFKRMNLKATSLIEMIKKEYHLKDE